MNILLSPTNYLPMKAGLPVVVHQLARGLSSKGHRVAIMTPKLEQAHPTFETIDGIEVHRLHFLFPWRILWHQSKISFLQFCLRSPLDIHRMVKLMFRKKVDIIHIHGLDGPHLPYWLLAQLIMNRPLVVTLHGPEFFRLNTRQNRVRSFLLRWAFRRATKVTAVSWNLAEEAAIFYPEVSGKIVTIPNGVALKEFGGSECFSFPSPYLLSLARLYHIKGHDVLLSAFQKVAEHDSRTHLIIAGDGSQRIRLQAIALALGLKDRVTFLGEVAQERAKELLAGCEFLVVSSWSEGVPIVALEAMASGKAFVGTHVGELPEIVSGAESGLLVAPGDPSALGDAMLVLLQNPAQRKAMGERGRAFVAANYDFSKTVDRYLDVYRKVLLQASEG